MARRRIGALDGRLEGSQRLEDPLNSRAVRMVASSHAIYIMGPCHGTIMLELAHQSEYC